MNLPRLVIEKVILLPLHVENSKLTRLNKYLSEVGYCSRREADKLIDQGRVTINGKVPEMGTKVSSNDIVHVDGEQINQPKEKHVYIAFNKPVGIVCTTAQNEKENIIDYINYPIHNLSNEWEMGSQF